MSFGILTFKFFVLVISLEILWLFSRILNYSVCWFISSCLVVAMAAINFEDKISLLERDVEFNAIIDKLDVGDKQKLFDLIKTNVAPVSDEPKPEPGAEASKSR